MAQVHANGGIDSLLRYTTRFGIYRIQIFKTLLISTLVLIFLTQIFHASSSSSTSAQSSHKDLLVIKPEDVYNSHYNSLVGLQDLEHLGLNERCNQFFEKLSQSNDFKDFDWFNSNLKDVKIVPKLKTYLEQKKIDQNAKGEKITNDNVKEWEKDYNQNFSQDKVYMSKLVDFISNLRIYGTCYIENNLFKEITGSKKAYNLFWEDEANKELANSNTFQISNELEIRLFPWITKIYPVFKHGLKQLGVGIPEISSSDNDDQDYNSKSSFLYNYKHGLNGEGIVIPVYDNADIKYLLKLAKVLRFVGNKLPIQIVHKGEIDELDETKIYEAFTKEFDVDEFFHSETIDSLPLGYDTALTKQDIYFVNIKMSISENYSSRLNRVSFKNFALLFSSFRKAMLLDASVLPFQRLTQILQSDKFTSSGSYFFPNLRLSSPARLNEVEFFKDLLPNKVDEHFFGIPKTSQDFISGSRFFTSHFAQVVNGDVMVIDKRDNFLGLLLSLSFSYLPLNFETTLIQNEFTWLGLLLAGEPDVYIHEIPTSLVGTFTDDPNRRIKLSASKEICSTHKGVFDVDNSTLLYISGGAYNCDKDISLEQEIPKPFYRGFNGNKESLKKWQLEKTSFKAAIIPVAQEIEAPNNIDEVDVSISNKEEYCKGEMLCVYDILGAKDEKKYHGEVIEFNEAQHQVIEFVEKLWS